ncbi:MAG TPA: hypothetical protein VHQ47_14625 [Phycisphaerae bacterium]|nr:hypothetical protein [Phycisphaerae bacterium]
MDTPTICQGCGKELTPGRSHFYVIHIHAYADDSPPVFTEEDLKKDHAAEMKKALADAAQFSEQELMDTIHRRVAFYLCGPCYRKWIENPVGG